MSLQEMKELFGTLILGSFAITLLMLVIAYKIAEISYKKAHKNTHKVHRRRQNKTEIVFDIGDTSKMTLSEIQYRKNQMRKELIENV